MSQEIIERRCPYGEILADCPETADLVKDFKTVDEPELESPILEKELADKIVSVCLDCCLKEVSKNSDQPVLAIKRILNELPIEIERDIDKPPLTF